MIFSVSDLKQFLYCPRIPYFTYVMPVDKKVTFKMESGQESHLHVSELEERRKLKLYGLEEGERLFRPYLRSERLRLCGILDMLIICPPPKSTGNRESRKGEGKGEGAEACGPTGAQKEWKGECYPVEFKDSTHAPLTNHRYQLTAYAMLVEDAYQRPVRKGFIHLIPVRKTYAIEITQDKRDFVKKVLSRMETMIREERMPDPTRSRGRCTDCEFRNWCGDIL